ncbi:13445_t:CDS:1, partial [Cetraspora pellucida]
ALTALLVKQSPAMYQSLLQELSIAFNLTIAFTDWPTILFNILASICIAVCLFITTKLACSILSNKLVNS